MALERVPPALEAAALLLEAAAALIILAGAAVALARWTIHRGPLGDPAHARHGFARSLLLALDFTIGSDVLSLAAAPDLDRVLVVGAVALVRIALTLILEYEEGRAERRGT